MFRRTWQTWLDAHVDINKFTTPQRQGQRDKNQLATPTAAEGAQGGILEGLRFILMGVWPDQGGGHGLTLGKERVKSHIEKFGGIVTKSFSRLTNALVIGNAPGPKKVIEAHNQSMKIITLAQLNNLILGDLTLDDLTSADYPESVYAVLDTEKIQVQHHPHLSVSQEQAQDGTAAELPQRQEDDVDMAEDGQNNG
jgi:BRCT domain type II-containing protein